MEMNCSPVAVAYAFNILQYVASKMIM